MSSNIWPLLKPDLYFKDLLLFIFIASKINYNYRLIKNILIFLYFLSKSNNQSAYL